MDKQDEVVIISNSKHSPHLQGQICTIEDIEKNGDQMLFVLRNAEGKRMNRRFTTNELIERRIYEELHEKR